MSIIDDKTQAMAEIAVLEQKLEVILDLREQYHAQIQKCQKKIEGLTESDNELRRTQHRMIVQLRDLKKAIGEET